MKKRFVKVMLVGALALIAALFVVCIPASAGAADAAEVTAGGKTTKYDTFAKAWTAANNAGTATVKLLANVDENNHNDWPIDVESNKTITLDLNGKTIDRGLDGGERDGSVITISGSLTLNDSSGNGAITGGCINNDEGLGGYGGGGGVHISDGTFIMNGGKIIGNKSINNNYGGGGGGVYMSDGMFTMNDGEITGNTIETCTGGGGVYMSDGTFTMNGGEISGNTTAMHSVGGGVYVYGGTVILSGEPKITDNTANSVTNNLHIMFDYSIATIDADAGGLRGNASIGVTTGNKPYLTYTVDITGNNSKNYKQYFTSDDSDYIVVNTGTGNAQKVVLALPKHTITLSAPDATNTYTTSVTATYGEAMPTATMPERTGYAFAGYFDDQTPAKQYYNADGTSANTWDKATAATLHAKWTAESYAVTLDMQGGTGGTTSIKPVYDSDMPAITKPTREYKITYDQNYTGSIATSGDVAYVFGGYYSATGGGGTQYYTADGASARTWDSTTITTLYARWTGGSVTLSTPARDGYAFGGWYEEAACTTSVGAGGDSYTPTADVTLYAKWTAQSYAVTLDMQGGTGGTTGIDPVYDSDMPAITKPTREYTITYDPNYTGSVPASGDVAYVFGGYFSAISGGGTQYYTADGASARTWDSTTITTLYAQWTSASVTLPTPTRDGFTFGGWYEEAECTTSVGAGGDSYTPTADITLYAKWTVIGYGIAYDLDGGSLATGVTNPASYTTETDTFTLNNPLRDGYAFAGWTGTNGTTPQTSVSVPKGSMGDRTYIANWTAHTYTVEFNKNAADALGTMNDQSFTYDAAQALSANAYTRAGNIFSGWATKPDGAKVYNDKESVINLTAISGDKVTLYAVWTIDAGDITVSGGGSFTEKNAGNVKIIIGEGIKGFGTGNLDSLELIGNGLFTQLTNSRECDISDGSIIIELRKAFLNTLRPGMYTLRAHLTGSGLDGRSVQTTIQVLSGATPPKTGDGGMPIAWLGLCAVGAMGIMLMRRRRRGA